MLAVTTWPRLRRVAGAAWAVSRATTVQAWADRVLGLAAEAGFWALLSLTPLLLVLLSLVGYLSPLFGAGIDARVEATLVQAAGTVLAPAAVQKVLEPVLTGVLHHEQGGVASLSLIVALWTGSTATSTYVNTIAIAYGMRDVRSAVRARLVAFGLYVGALVVAVVVLPLLVTAPQGMIRLIPRPAVPVLRPIVTYAYWPVLAALCTGLLVAFYHLAAPLRGRWRRELPGAVAAMLIWVVSSLLLREYLSFAIGHSPTYGALSAPVAALLFLYFTALAVLLGAELNAQMAGLRPAGTPRPPDRPAPRRRA